MAWLGATVSATAAAGSAPPTEQESRRAHAIASRIMSPFCPGSTVASCTSPRAAAWRADILSWVREGRTDEEIRARLQSQVPGRDLSGTPDSGIDWGLPLAVVIAGSGLLGWLLRRFMQRNSKPAPAPETDRGELDEKLDRELRDLDDV